MVLAEVKANIKDQFDRAAEIERRYEGVITDPEDEHQVKRHLMTVEHLPRHGKPSSRRRSSASTASAQGLEEYSRPSNGHRQPSGGDPASASAVQPWRPVHPLGRVRAASQSRAGSTRRSTATTSASS